MSQPDLPSDLEYVRTTDVFDNTSVPPGLLRAHRVADGVWARLVVHSGAVIFVFDDQPEHPRTVHAGGTVTISPARWHHLELDEPATFSLDFYRAPSTPRPVPGTESTALHPEPGRVPSEPRGPKESSAYAGDRVVEPLESPADMITSHRW